MLNRILEIGITSVAPATAICYPARVIGVVLTGGESDGTAGLKTIHAAGGIGIVQDPQDADDPEMPKSALSGDSPDYCVRIEDMAQLLNTLSQSISHMKVPA